MSTRSIGLLAATAFVATVWIANLLVTHVGIVPVGFGLHAPAAVFAAGAAFTLRDITQRSLGRSAVLVAIAIGGALSALLSPQIAVASTVAFTVSELVDFAAFTALEERSIAAAVAVSNTLGAIVDSYIFLTIAFGSTALMAGQIVGKSWVTVATLCALAVGRGLLPRNA